MLYCSTDYQKIMKRYTEYCDLCQIEIGKGTNNGKHGFCSEIGFSLGGWVFRQNFIEKRSIDVCSKCF